MKHSRHPLAWRVDAVRASLVLSVAALGLSDLPASANPESSPDLEAPAVGIPVVTPRMTVSTPGLPEFTMPTITPTFPSVGAQGQQMGTARRMYELKVADHQRNRGMRTSHPDRIDYADALIHLERFDEAIEELEAIEERFPDAYTNAHLLGVASELSGNLPAARRWFAEAVQRDPDAQGGTGWLRVALVEAHLALREDPTWLKTHSVLDGCAGRSEAELARAVKVQVEDRRNEFAPDDPVVADLYFQVGARMTAPEQRNKYFALSVETSPLRKGDIEGQQVIRARGPETGGGH